MAVAQAETPLLPHPRLASATPFAHEELTRLYGFYSARPTNAELCAQIAKHLQDYEEHDQAHVWYQESYRHDSSPQHEQVLLEGYLREKNTRDAAGIIEKRLADNPNNEAFIVQAADLAEEGGMLEKAGHLFVRAFGVSGNPDHLRKATDRFLWAGNPKKALQMMRKLKTLIKPDAAFLEKMADTAEWGKDLPGAIALLEEALAKHPRRATLRKKIIERCLWAGDLAKAETVVREALAREPHHPGYLGSLADILEAGNKTEESLLILNRLPESELPTRRRLRRAQLRFAQKDFAGALTDTRTVLARPSNSMTPEIRLLAAILASSCLSQQKQYQESWSVLELAGTIIGSPAAAKISRADVETFLRQRVDTARTLGDQERLKQCLDGVLKFFPADIPALREQAAIHRSQQRPQEAKALLLKADRASPKNPEVCRDLAEVLMEVRDLHRARAYLEFLLPRQESDPFLRESLAEVYTVFQEWYKALPLRWLQWTDDKNRDTLRTLSTTLSKTNHPEKSAELLLDHLAKNPFDPELEEEFLRVATFCPLLSASWGRLKSSFQEAFYQDRISSLTAQLEKMPENLELRRLRGETYLWMEKPKRALPDVLEVHYRQPDHLDSARVAIETAEWAGDLPLAITLRRALHQKDPDNATNTLRLAQQLGWNQRQAEAIPLYDKIIRDGHPDGPDMFLAAGPVQVWGGKFQAARRLWEQANTSLDRKNWREYGELMRQKKQMAKEWGELIRVWNSFFHDTEGVRATKTTFFSRHTVKDLMKWETTVTDIAMSQEKHQHRSFRGRWFQTEWQQWYANGDRLSIAVRGLQDHYSDRDRVMLPRLSLLQRQFGRETEWTFQEDPVMDTPEALRRGLTFRNVRAQHVRPLSDMSSVSSWLQTGRFSDGNSASYAGAAYENLTRADPRQGWRYIYSRHHSQGDGGSIYYTPGKLGSHQLQMFGEKTLFPRWSFPLKISWNAFAGQEEARATSWGIEGILEGKILSSLMWEITGGLLQASQSRFNSSGGRYGQWHWATELDWTFW